MALNPAKSSNFEQLALKGLTGEYDTDVTLSFEKHQGCRTRGHNLKLANHRCHYDLRKYFLHTNNKCLEQLARICYLCLYHGTDSFKNKLDKFWSNQALIYDYEVELTGIGNKSFI